MARPDLPPFQRRLLGLLEARATSQWMPYQDICRGMDRDPRVVSTGLNRLLRAGLVEFRSGHPRQYAVDDFYNHAWRAKR